MYCTHTHSYTHIHTPKPVVQTPGPVARCQRTGRTTPAQEEVCGDQAGTVEVSLEQL